jgi:multiple sugar transport system ATP-binding protein
VSSIELRRVSREFDAGSKALDDVDLSVDDGERLVVLGPSGSGKTTILRLIAGLDQPTAGSIRLGGVDVDNLPPHRRNVAMVFQNPTLYPHLDVARNLEFGLKARSVPRTERKRRVGEVASLLKIDALLGRRPASLSGGERQRVAIGRAVVRRPAVLLLDEPFSSLDLPLRAALRRELLDLHDAFRTTLVHVTHDQGEALGLGQRIAVLDRGRLVQFAPPRELYERPASPVVAAFIGSPPMNLIPCTLTREGSRRAVAVGDRRWTIDDAVNAPEPADGLRRPMLLGIRPEHLHVRPTDAPDDLAAERPSIATRIRRVEFQGDSMLLTIDVAGAPAVARVANHDDFHEGQGVAVSLDLAFAVWFPAEQHPLPSAAAQAS